MTTSIAWPAWMPAFQMEGYGYQRVDPVIRTELATGRMRARRRFTDGPFIVTGNWLMTQPYFAYFEKWWFETIDAGALSFNMTFNVGANCLAHECRFLETYQLVELKRGDLYRVTARFEAVQLQLITDELASILVAYGEAGIPLDAGLLSLVEFLDLFEIYVNIDLPGSEMVPGGLG